MKKYQLKAAKLDLQGNEVNEIILKATTLSKLTEAADKLGLRWKRSKTLLFGGYYVDDFGIAYYPEITYE